MKKVLITDFLTADEIKQAVAMYTARPRHQSYARAVCEAIIRPNLQRINRALGQENDPMYLAYAVEYVMGEAERE
jgi:hypothetical protein